MTVPRRRGMTEQAAQASIEQTCRMLRLPAIRGDLLFIDELETGTESYRLAKAKAKAKARARARAGNP
jgi:hypothetical protein